MQICCTLVQLVLHCPAVSIGCAPCRCLAYMYAAAASLADLQMVNMSLRILSRPLEDKLPSIFQVHILHFCLIHVLAQPLTLVGR